MTPPSLAPYWPHSNPDPTEQSTADRWCPGTHPLSAIPTGAPIWCLQHAEDIRAALAGLPRMAALAGNRRDGALNAGRAETDRTRRTRTTASPSPGFDLLEELAQWAWAWSDTISDILARRQVTAIRARNDGVPALQLVEHITYLTENLTPLLVSAVAVEFGEEALGWARRLETAAGQEKLRHRLPAPCPSCDRLALVRDDGTDHVDCAACHRRWDAPEYARLVLVLASEEAAR